VNKDRIIIYEDPEALKNLVFLGKKVICRLLGKGFLKEYYIKAITEFLSIFLDSEILANNSHLVDSLDFNEDFFQSEYYPENNKLELLQIVVSLKYYNGELDIRQIILMIASFDCRFSYAIAFLLGLMPQIKNKNEFQTLLKVHHDTFLEWTGVGLKQLIDSIRKDELPSLSPFSNEKANKFIRKLRNPAPNDFIRFTNGDMLLYGSSSYKIANLIRKKQESLDFSKLTEIQTKILHEFLADFDKTGQFRTPSEIMSNLELGRTVVFDNLEAILEKITSKKLYMRADGGHITEINENSSLAKLIHMYRNDRSIIKDKRISPDERKFIRKILDSRDANGIYSSATQIANSLGFTLTSLARVVKVLESDLVVRYFSKDGDELQKNSQQMKLLKIPNLSEVKPYLTKQEDMLLELLIKRDGQVLSYNHSDILEVIGYEGDKQKALSALRTRIQRLTSKVISLSKQEEQ
jgi:hypothetical protein